MARSRRSPSNDAPARGALLDAAESLMLEEGYAAVTTRRVATRAGVNNGLIHYYFGTMDSMFVDLFRRSVGRSFAQMPTTSSTQPLWEMWEAMRDFSGNALMSEFIALSNHRPLVREEIASQSALVREAHVVEMSRVLASYGVVEPEASPAAIGLLMMGTARFLQMEAAFGLTVGHDDLIQVIERRIAMLEGDRIRTA
jgi:AcrR family transcriptional regulator